MGNTLYYYIYLFPDSVSIFCLWKFFWMTMTKNKTKRSNLNKVVEQEIRWKAPSRWSTDIIAEPNDRLKEWVSYKCPSLTRVDQYFSIDKTVGFLTSANWCTAHFTRKPRTLQRLSSCCLANENFSPFQAASLALSASPIRTTVFHFDCNCWHPSFNHFAPRPVAVTNSQSVKFAWIEGALAEFKHWIGVGRCKHSQRSRPKASYRT